MIPDYQTLMLPVLHGATSGIDNVGDLAERMASEFKLDDQERSQLLPSGRDTIIRSRTYWARNYLTKAGLLRTTRRGRFEITDRGREALTAGLPRIDNKYLARFPEFQDYVGSGRGTDKESDDGNGTRSDQIALEDERTADEIIRATHRQLERQLASELIDRILLGSPAFFEQVIVSLVVAMGYGGSFEDAGRALGRSGDRGVDGVVDQDVLGLDRIYIQAKRYKRGNNVGAGEVRDFSGGLNIHRATKGLFVTTSDFTADAVDNAARLNTHIILVDGIKLAQLMIRYNVGVRAEETLHLKKIDEDFFE